MSHMVWRALACISILCGTTVCAQAEAVSSYKTAAHLVVPANSESTASFAQEFAFALHYHDSGQSRTARLMSPFQNAARFVGAKLLRIR